MPDELPNETPTDAAPTQEDLLRERKRANDAHAAARRQERELRQTQQSIQQLQQELDELKRGRQQPAGRVATANGNEDPEPNRDDDPMGWFAWTRREDARLREREQLRTQAETLNTFALTSESIARQQVPDYDQAVAFLKASYRKELEDSGELDETAIACLSDSSQQQNVSNRMAEKGMTQMEAARDLCADAAFEWRRARIVQAQRRLGGNPALKAVEMAKERGYGEPVRMERFGFKPLSGQPGSRTTSGLVDIDESLKELERKKNLRAGTNTTADIRDGGEVPEKRAWTREQLEEARRTNPALYKQAIREIAADADADPRSLANIITR